MLWVHGIPLLVSLRHSAWHTLEGEYFLMGKIYYGIEYLKQENEF